MRLLILTILIGFATLSGCAFPGVYKLNVQQGNIVTQDMLDQLEPGMTERQVKYVMGTPVIQTPLPQASNIQAGRKPQRWDYIYTLEQRDKVTKQYHIRVFFDINGQYSHYRGELPADSRKEKSQDLPAEAEKTNLLDTSE